MLPHNILGSWVFTSALVTELKQAVAEYIECSDDHIHESGMHSINWIERTEFTFGDSDWSKTEGSMIFENRRAVLLRTDPTNPSWSHLIFLAMFSSSLVNLQHSIAESVHANQFKTLNAVDLDLEKASTKLLNSITGTEYVDLNNEILISKLPIQPPLESGFISKLRLRLGDPNADLEVTRNGQLTFVDPDLSLDQVTSLANEIIQNIPLRNLGEQPLASWESGGTLVS